MASLSLSASFSHSVMIVDDISDLLKFYRKPYYTPEDNNTPSNNNNNNNRNYNSAIVSVPSVSSTQTMQQETVGVVGLETSEMSAMPNPTTPANMGYISSWFNSLNFTLMVTLRVKVHSITPPPL